MKNKLKRLLCLMLVLMTVVSMLPVTNVSAASSLSSTGSLYVGGTGVRWSSKWGSYLLQDLGLRMVDGSVAPALCMNRGWAMSSAIEGHTYGKGSKVEMSPSLPFLDYFSYQCYEQGLATDTPMRTRWKSMANAVVWMEQEGTINDSLLTECRNFDSATFSAETSPQLYAIAKENYYIASSSGATPYADIAESAGFMASIVTLWDNNQIPHRDYYVYYYGGYSGSHYQSLLVSEYEPQVAGGWLALKKVDAEDESVMVPGATFTAYYDETCTEAVFAGMGETDANGVAYIQVDPLPNATSNTHTFYLKETGFPDEYMKIPDDKLPKYSVEVDFTANKDKANAAWVNDGQGIPNTKGISGWIVIDKENEDGEPLSGAAFTLFDAKGETALQYPVTTDSNGRTYMRLSYTTDEYGTVYNYIVRETGVPEGYDDPIVKDYPVTVDFEVNITKDKAATVNDGQPIINTKGDDKDTQVSETTKIRKVDSKDTTKGLEGAIFSYSAVFYESAPTDYKNEEALGIYKNVSGATDTGTFPATDSNGEINIQWTNPTGDNYVSPGRYTIWETTAPDGYQLSTEKQSLELWVEIDREVDHVDANGTTYYNYIYTAKASTQELTFTNDKLNTVVLKKVDESGNPLSGATFEVYRGSTLLDTKDTDANGEIRMEAVESGVYYFNEIKAPAGYLLPDITATEPLEVDATDTTKTEYVTTMTNHKTPEIVITKYQAGTKTPLAGATYYVEIEGKKVGNGSFTTDSEGKIVIPYATFRDVLDLSNNTWQVTAKETNAPEHYLLNEEPQTVTMERGKYFAEFEFYNEPIPGIIITKEEKGTNIRLNGATYEISIDNTPRLTKTITDNGIITITPEEYGKWIDDTVKDEWDITVKELTPPAGYLLDPKPQTLTLKEGQTLLEFSFENIKVPELLVIKTDSETGAPIPETHFKVEVSDAEGTKFSGTYKTGEDGTFHLNYENCPELFDTNMASWYVTVTETKAAPGYLLANPASVTKQIFAGDGVVEFPFTNIKYPDLVIIKQDAYTGQKLGGASFKIEIDGKSVGTMENPTGELTITYDTLKKYMDINADEWAITVTETNPPEGYFLDTNPTQTHYLKKGQSIAPFVFKNVPYPDIVITKADLAEPTKMLPGTLFQVFIEAQSLGTYKTDAEGQITITYDEYKQYLGENTDQTDWTVRVEEIAAPENYFNATPNNWQEHELKKGEGLKRFTFLNQEYPDVVVLKVDEITGDALPGATFELVHSNGTVAARIGKTDVDGKITFEHVQPGTYTLRETKAPEGYILDEDNVKTVIIEPGCDPVLSFTFTNSEKPDMTIRKLDAITKEPLQYTTFKVERESNGTIESLGEFTTDKDGVVEFKDLAEGWYIITEVTPTDGYQNCENPSQKIYLQPDENATVTFENYPLHAIIIKKTDSATGKPMANVTFRVTYVDGSGAATTIGENFVTGSTGTVTVTGLEAGHYIVEEIAAPDDYVMNTTAQDVYLPKDDQAVVTVSFTNAPKGELIIIKVDSVTKLPLAGAKFKVTTSDGTVVDNFSSGTPSASTDGNGVVSSNGIYTTDVYGQIKLYDLEPDSYVVTEIEAPKGYVLDSTPQTVRVNTNDTQTLTFGNPPKGNLIIRKIDAVTGKPLSDAEFKVTTSGGCFVGNDGGAITSNGIYYTDENGEIRITTMNPGAYVVTETVAPAGYVLDSRPQTVNVDTGDTQTLTFKNQPKGSLIIQKIDAVTRQPLQGAQFKITTSDGKFVGNAGGTITSNGIYWTDENGQIILTGLEPDTYVVTETKAPDGYVMDDAAQTVVVNTNDTQTLTFTNTPIGGFILIKEDGETGERLKGAEFEIREMDGEIIDTYTTDSNGKIYLPELSSGWYVATELKAPKGYRLDDTPTNIEVEDGKTTTVTVKNEKVSNIVIRKVDSDTGEGLYGAVFVIYDSKSNPIGEYTSDDRGYVYVEDIPDGRYKIREIEAPEGYLLDNGYKTVYVRYGGSSEVTWKNTAQKGQIQVAKYAGQANPVTGTPAGAPLPGAVFEIAYERSGRVAGYITTDARGIAASKPLPLGRYIVKEVTAPAYYQLSNQTFDVTIEYPNQIIKLGAYNDPAVLDVSITKTGIKEVLAGSNMSYTISVANTSNVALEQFYWHDRLPTDVTLPVSLTTGTYNQRLNYRILYRTNYNDYRVLASNLNTGNNYAFVLNNLPLMAGEVVTDIHYDFGTVPAAFQSVIDPTVTVSVKATTPTGYQIVNRGDVGGLYQGTWETGITSWITITRNFTPTPQLPKTGY